MAHLTKDDIKALIPHREPMLLVDEIDIDDNAVAHGKKYISGEEFFVQGHFPGHPVVPGVILCEIMAQACTPLVGEDIIGTTPLYAGINNVRFKNSVVPGDTVETTAKITNRRGPIFFIEAQATVNGKLCCKGDLTFMLIPNDKLDETLKK